MWLRGCGTSARVAWLRKHLHRILRRPKLEPSAARARPRTCAPRIRVCGETSTGTFRLCLSSRVRILCVRSASYRLTLYPYMAAHTYVYTYTRTCTRIQYGPPPAGVKSTGQQAKRRSITGDLGGSAPRSVFRGIQTVLVIALKHSGEEGGFPFRMNSTFQESMKY